MRLLRRRLGLSQRELAYVIGYRNKSHISHIESGTRTPQFAEVLMIELIFGIPAVTIFPEVRHALGQRVSQRLKSLLADPRTSCMTNNTRASYKPAQIKRVLASLRSHDECDRTDVASWQTLKSPGSV